MTLELLWRKRTHSSMFLAGGSAFLLLGQVKKRHRSPLVQAAAGALAVTAVELASGLLFNRKYGVWDYRKLPYNYRGQVCLPYTLLWVPVSLGAMRLYDGLDRGLERR